jgi:hypothetical protein
MRACATWNKVPYNHAHKRNFVPMAFPRRVHVLEEEMGPEVGEGTLSRVVDRAEALFSTGQAAHRRRWSSRPPEPGLCLRYVTLRYVTVRYGPPQSALRSPQQSHLLLAISGAVPGSTSSARYAREPVPDGRPPENAASSSRAGAFTSTSPRGSPRSRGCRRRPRRASCLSSSPGSARY